MLINKLFFHFLLPRSINATLLLTTLTIYAHQNDLFLILLGTGVGFMSGLMLLLLGTLMPEVLQTVLHLLTGICSTILAFYMIQQQKKLNTACRFLLTLTPIFYLLSQSIDISSYIFHHHKMDRVTSVYTMTSNLLFCSVIGLTYYAAIVYIFSGRVQKCIYSFVWYFTGAIYLSKVIGYLENCVHPPPIKGLMAILLQQSQERSMGILHRMMNGIFATYTIGTCYSVYWLVISCCLIYDIKK